MSDTIRRNLALFPIGIVQKLTELTPRQIRYYEQHKLISPARTEGNQRLFSFNDVERLLEIKQLIDQGLNISGIKKMIGQSAESSAQADEPAVFETDELKEDMERADANVKDMSEEELHELLTKELLYRLERNGHQNTLIAGQLSRFFN